MTICVILFFFVATLLGGCFGGYSFFVQKRSVIKIDLVDILFMIISLSYFAVHSTSLDVWVMGNFSLFLVYWAIRSLGKLNHAILYGFILVGALVLAFVGYLQYAGLLEANSPYFDITGPYCTPTVYAGMLSFFLCILFVWCMHSGYRGRFKRLTCLTIIVCVCCLPMLIATGSRGAWIALIVAVARLVYLFHFRKYMRMRNHRWMKRAFVISVFLSLMALGSVLYLFRPDSVAGRVLIWKVALRMVQEKPLTGFGAEGFTGHYMYYQASYLEKEGTEREKYLAGSNHLAYNEPLRLIVNYGISGVLLYIGFLYAVFATPRKKDIVTLSAQSFFIGYFVWGLCAYPAQAFHVQILAVLALGCLSVRCKSRCLAFYLPLYADKALRVLSLLVVLGLSYIYCNTYQSFRQVDRILYSSSHSQTELGKSAEKLAMLEKEMQHEAFFWMNYCLILSKSDSDSTLLEKLAHWEQLYPTPETYIMKGDAYQRMGQYDKAESAYWLAHFMVPSRQRARSRLAILYRKQRRFEEATLLAHEVLTEKVKVYGFETYEIHQELKRIFENQLK